MTIFFLVYGFENFDFLFYPFSVFLPVCCVCFVLFFGIGRCKKELKKATKYLLLLSQFYYNCLYHQ